MIVGFSVQKLHLLENVFFFPLGLIDEAFSSLDLSGKVFIFSRESNSDHVKLKTSNTVLKSASTCFR